MLQGVLNEGERVYHMVCHRVCQRMYEYERIYHRVCQKMFEIVCYKTQERIWENQTSFTLPIRRAARLTVSPMPT